MLELISVLRHILQLLVFTRKMHLLLYASYSINIVPYYIYELIRIYDLQ